ncbi:DJ-1/PfpI family protein [uncultured Dubosiella sp.]|uniref:DJ-1/PfpI family protein n=1 Tax=uncultured Dubosiella sp. TaxID=1937011 RepID=UPI0025B17F6F|nr:DJ-1/PfpI family protein [uncultured Dubosiella sp.]
MNNKVVMMMADGVEEIEATVPFDLMREAGLDVDLVSAQNKSTAIGANGMVFANLKNLEGYDFSVNDTLVLPGGAAYKVFLNTPEVLEQVKAFAQNPQKVLGAICASASIPGTLGLYQGKKYTCVPGLNGDFGGTYENVHSVIDGNLVTGISVGGAFDFAFNLIKVLKGEAEMKKVQENTCWILPKQK